ncbi:A disintegrin and metalloproteinase with thrombospondin motifs 7 [Triplophysa tibetana]|uniref:A disintegrin and metalloproteinase with thrombospondin motifs 7 n=1 Tax=Triplophysa tibetana TaxID=1572043 RepID=A0A5A9PSB8_9TELE|nr:A disintegrin and metalloproteinase with thrombospondin motifs 7 [Triplophysa tibetana]
MGSRPASVNGGWASWSQWSECSRTCRVGVQSAHRDCVNPVPKHGGKYCVGERRRYRACNRDRCPPDQPSFRYIQCNRFNTIPYKGKFYKWTHVNNRVNPCELHCRPVNEHFTERMLDTVIDGTRCYEGTHSRDICINGICKNIGCDYEIDSDAVEDQCGVCHGNGSTCETVRKTFENSEGLGYVDIGLIPEGARDIRIEEVAEAGNFLALRSNDPEKYFLNGGWTIQWNGEYKAAGTIFTYERNGQLENLSSPGPTMELVWIQLLFQETNPGVRYEYTISTTLVESNNGSSSYFHWMYGAWTECSATCGSDGGPRAPSLHLLETSSDNTHETPARTVRSLCFHLSVRDFKSEGFSELRNKGVQRQVVHCVERTSGIVEEQYCDLSTRPDDKQTSCNKEPCPAMWWVGDWQKCSSTCGDMSISKRTVLCIQSVGLDERKALLPSECQHLSKPEAIAPCNTRVLCPADWIIGNWSECSVSCGMGLWTRPVTCSWNTGVDCDPKLKPDSTTSCYAQNCTMDSDIFGSDWSGSGASSKEVFNEINAIPHDNHMLKFGVGSIRSQPKGNVDLNDIVEDDFSHYSHVEKSSENSVADNLLVDDFYYDYNFIKFHEDLSYDFDRDVNDVYENLGVKDGDLKGTDVPVMSTSLPSTITDKHGTTALPSDSTTSKNTEGYDLLGENNDKLFAEDYFLPVITTSEPSSTGARLFNKWTASDFDLGLSQDLSTTRNPPPAPGTLNQPQDNHSYEAMPNELLTPASLETSDRTGDVRNEDKFGDDVPGDEGDWESSPTFKPPSDLFPSQWSMTDSPTTTTSHTSERISSNDGFTNYAGLTESTAYNENHEQRFAERETATSDSLSEDFTPSPTSSSSAKPYSSMTSTAGTTALPPTDVESHLEPLVTEIPDATFGTETKKMFRARATVAQYPSTEPWGTPVPHWTQIDYNEIKTTRILTPVVLKPTVYIPNEQTSQGIGSDPFSSPPVPTPLVPSSSYPAYWRKGNWSACSTSCGLGAIWRSVSCSTGDEADCDISTRPVPARRCYHRPCAAWKIGNWSKCSNNCGGGVKRREIQCYDTRDLRSLRPFHCQATSPRPPVQMTCSIETCLEWYTSSWGPCSELCGGGDQQRLVTCPETGRCNEDVQPSYIQACNVHPCTQWVTGSWGQCTVFCGGGIQRRLVKCVNTKAELEEENEHIDCDHEPRPRNAQKCNIEECDGAPSGQPCLRDHLTLRFCQTLLWLGRCQLPSVQTQCCKTCGLNSRGSDRTTRR